MNRPKILIPAFMTILIFMFVLLVFSASQILQSKRFLESTIQEQSDKTDWFHELQFSANQRSLLIMKIINEENVFNQDDLIQRFYRFGQTFMKFRQKIVSGNLSKIEEDLLRQHLDNSIFVISHQHKVIKLIQAEKIAQASYFFVHSALPSQQKNNIILNKLVKLQSSTTKQTISNEGKHSNFNFLILIFGGTLVILGGTFIFYFVYKNLKETIKHLSLTKNTLNKIILELDNQQYALNQHAIVSISDTTGTITYVNEKFCEVSQYSENELLGQQHNIINSGYHPKKLFKDMWSTIQNGNTWQGEFCNRKKDGTDYWVETTIVPFLDEYNVPYQYIAIRTEITRIKNIEHDLKLSLEITATETEKAQQSNTLKESLISTMTHELRTPLNSILGFSQLLLIEKDKLSELQIDNINNISDSGEELLYNIDNIMLYGKLKSNSITLQYSEIELNTLIQSIINELKNKYQKSTILPTLKTSYLFDLNIDPNLLRKALYFVIDNAIRFTKQGSINIKLSEIRKDSPLPDHNKKAKEDLILITIADTGIGIPSDKISFVFDEFRQADEKNSRQYEGFGIELALTKNIVNLHSGETWLTSEVDKGTTVYITIPKD